MQKNPFLELNSGDKISLSAYSKYIFRLVHGILDLIFFIYLIFNKVCKLKHLP